MTSDVVMVSEVDYEVDPDIVVTVQDVHSCGNCNRGARALFRNRGWDWSKFITVGLTIREFHTFDEYLRGPYEHAMKRLGRW
jgi:hypothetical protein